MKISYDKNLKIAGIGVNPWSRLGLERWFDNYKIGSLYGWDLKVPKPEVIDLYSLKQRGLRLITTNRLLNDPQFGDVLVDRLHGYSLFVYKPSKVRLPDKMLSADIKLVSTALTKPRFEDKVYLRKKFKNKLHFPAYKFYDGLPDYSQLSELGEEVVLQQAKSSGSKGTFIIKDRNDYEAAKTYLSARKRNKFLASKYIENASERSLQCCATKYGVFIGPLQKQLVNKKELSNPLPESGKFCGAEIDAKDNLRPLYDQMQKVGRQIGEELITDGYKGIFGVDFLVSPAGELFVIEVNQRITGVTPLLTKLYRGEQDIPFTLLHVLEQGNFDYQITDETIENHSLNGSLLIFHSKQLEPATVIDSLASGLYEVPSLRFKQAGYELPQDDSLLIQRLIPVSVEFKPRFSVMEAYSRQNVLAENDSFSSQTLDLIDAIYKRLDFRG